MPSAHLEEIKMIKNICARLVKLGSISTHELLFWGILCGTLSITELSFAASSSDLSGTLSDEKQELHANLRKIDDAAHVTEIRVSFLNRETLYAPDENELDKMGCYYVSKRKATFPKFLSIIKSANISPIDRKPSEIIANEHIYIKYSDGSNISIFIDNSPPPENPEKVEGKIKDLTFSANSEFVGNIYKWLASLQVKSRSGCGIFLKAPRNQ